MQRLYLYSLSTLFFGLTLLHASDKESTLVKAVNVFKLNRKAAPFIPAAPSCAADASSSHAAAHLSSFSTAVAATASNYPIHIIETSLHTLQTTYLTLEKNIIVCPTVEQAAAMARTHQQSIIFAVRL